MHKGAEPRAVSVRKLALELDGWREHGQMLDAIITSAATRQQIVEHPPRLPDALRVGLAHNVRRVDPRTDDADAVLADEAGR